MTEAWKVTGSETTTAIWVETAAGERVCTVKNCETDADRARLIAAAPDMLAALRAFVLQTCQGNVLERDACVSQARAALAKAEGRS